MNCMARRLAVSAFALLVSVASAQRINPATDIKWPSCTSVQAYNPSTNSCFTPSGGTGGGGSLTYDSSIQNSGGWIMNHDAGTPGTASGVMTQGVSSPSVSGSAAQFDTTFTGSGGEIYYNAFNNDTTATDFFYDAWVYIPSSAGSTILNLETDMNQVVSGGDTIIYGIQCDGFTGTWDYTENSGTAISYVDTWVHSSQPCDPSSWTKDTWHHLQYSYSRDGSENVTYSSIWFDGTLIPINQTVFDGFTLGWTVGTLLTNFQIDGNGSGSNTVYLDSLNIGRGTGGGGGGSIVYPLAGIAVSTGTAWGASLTAPTGALVGTTDTQTLSNKTVDGVTAATFGFLDPTSSVQTQLNAKVGTGTTVNGHALSSNVTVSATDVGLGSVTNDAQTKNSIVPNSFAGVRFGNSGTIDTAATSAQVQTVIGSGVYDASGAAAARAAVETCTNQVLKSASTAGTGDCTSVTNAMLSSSSTNVNGATCTLGSSCTVSGAQNTQTASYTLVASDLGKLVVMNCTSACTVTLNASPTNGFYGAIESVGTSVATVSLNGKNFNASTSVPVLLSDQTLPFWSDGTNYFGQGLPVAGNNIVLTAAANGLTFSVTNITGVRFGNGTSVDTAATGAQIAAAIGSTAVTNATNATNATSATSATSATNATNATNVSNTGGVTTNATYYPCLLAANTTSNQPCNTPTNLLINPSLPSITTPSTVGLRIWAGSSNNLLLGAGSDALSINSLSNVVVNNGGSVYPNATSNAGSFGAAGHDWLAIYAQAIPQINDIAGIYYVTANFTTAANTSLQTITGLSWTLIASTAQKVPFRCHLAYSQATAAVAVAFGIQAATISPNQIFATGEQATSATATTKGVLAALASTTATNIVSATPGATATNLAVDLNGEIDNPSNVSTNTINIMVSTATAADAVTVLKGSFCRIN